MLLVLDNFEQLIDCVEPISQLCTGVPQLKFLITSRVRLKIPGEHVIRLLGVSWAQSGSDLSPAELLFQYYAQRVKPSFEVAGENREPVQSICKLVDGMPLAIELAAAWVTLLPVKFIADQIQKNIDWLSTSVGYTHQQQKSVRAVLNYFWGVLSADEQACLQRLSVFSGGFERELAQEIAGASLFFLSALVDRVFLNRTSTGRYLMHEMLRQYAAEKLSSDPHQKEEISQRHAEAYAAFVARSYKMIDGPEHLVWSARFEAEHNNFRGALEWLLDKSRDAERARAMSFHLMGFWYQNGYLTEGRRWLKLAIDASTNETQALADALGSTSFLAAAQGDYDDSKQSGLRALEICQRLNYAPGISEALHNLAFNESFAGNYKEAVRLYEQCIAMEQARGNTSQIATSLHNLAIACMGLGNSQRAAELCRESIALSREGGDPIDIAYSVSLLALVCSELDCTAEALPDFLDALTAFASSDDVTGAVMALESTAVILERQSDINKSLPVAVHATQVWACAQQLRRKSLLKLDLHLVQQFAAMAERLQERLGQAQFEVATLRGQAMTLAQALQLAQREIATLLLGQ